MRNILDKLLYIRSHLKSQEQIIRINKVITAIRKEKNCKQCGQFKPIHGRGMCYTCYAKETASGTCEQCGKENTILRTELCDSCYRKKNNTGKCNVCSKVGVLKAGLCSTCYKAKNYGGKCPLCNKYRTLFKDPSGERICGACWAEKNKKGPCRRCDKVRVLSDNLCSTCYSKENYQGKCKKENCDNEGILTDGYCQSCYRKDNSLGKCRNCEEYSQLRDNYCNKCHGLSKNVKECPQCKKQRIIYEKDMCFDCFKEKYDYGICSMCGKKDARNIDKDCPDCADDVELGQMKHKDSMFRNVLIACMGKENINWEPDELNLGSQKIKPICEIRDLKGKWAPCDFFKNGVEIRNKYKDINNFQSIRKKYLEPKNYIAFSFEHDTSEKIMEKLKKRGFLTTDNRSFGQKITEKEKKPERAKMLEDYVQERQISKENL